MIIGIALTEEAVRRLKAGEHFTLTGEHYGLLGLDIELVFRPTTEDHVREIECVFPGVGAALKAAAEATAADGRDRAVVVPGSEPDPAPARGSDPGKRGLN